MTKSEDKLGQPSATPVAFPRWREVLHNEQLSASLMHSHEGEIFASLKYLKTARCRASVASVLQYLLDLEGLKRSIEATRSAVRWFFQAAAIQAIFPGIVQVGPARGCPLI